MGVKCKTANVRINVISGSVLANHCYRGKAISVTYFVGLCVALVTQHAERMRCITLLSLPYLAVTFFFHLSHKWQEFLSKVFEHKIGFDFIYKVCPEHFSF